MCSLPQTKSTDGAAVRLAGPQSLQFHLSCTSSPITSAGLSRCLARSQSPNQIHFICNQLEPLALMEEIRAGSKNYKLTTPDQQTMTWTRWLLRADEGGGGEQELQQR